MFKFIFYNPVYMYKHTSQHECHFDVAHAETFAIYQFDKHVFFFQVLKQSGCIKTEISVVDIRISKSY